MPLPPPLWSARDAQELLAVIEGVGREGLDPADYDPAGLAASLGIESHGPPGQPTVEIELDADHPLLAVAQRR